MNYTKKATFGVLSVSISSISLYIFTTAANHHTERHRHQDHLRELPPFNASLQQRRGHRQTDPRVQLRLLRRQALGVGHPEDLHDGGGDRPEHRAHGCGFLQRLRPSGESPGGSGRVRHTGLGPVHQQLWGLHASFPHKVPAVQLHAGPHGTEEQRGPGGH